MSKRPVPAFAAAAAACAVALGVTGCGSSSKPSSTPASSSAPASSAPASSATTAPAAGGVPAVSNATNLKVEPVPARGTGSPPATLVTKDLVVGTGPPAVAPSTVQVQYTGTLYSNGQVFDASWTDQGPATFPLSGVVPGFKDAIVGMKVGGRREVVIPPALGYGANGQPPTIPPNATLVFVIDLLRVS